MVDSPRPFAGSPTAPHRKPSTGRESALRRKAGWSATRWDHVSVERPGGAITRDYPVGPGKGKAAMAAFPLQLVVLVPTFGC